MKKIILITILILNIYPFINKNGDIELTSSMQVSAQDYEDDNPDCMKFPEGCFGNNPQDGGDNSSSSSSNTSSSSNSSSTDPGGNSNTGVSGNAPDDHDYFDWEDNDPWWMFDNPYDDDTDNGCTEFDQDVEEKSEDACYEYTKRCKYTFDCQGFVGGYCFTSVTQKPPRIEVETVSETDNLWEHGREDCEFEIDCYGNKSMTNNCRSISVPHSFYIKVDGDGSHYTNGAMVKVCTKPTTTFTIYDENGVVYDVNNIVWQKNSTKSYRRSSSCIYTAASPETYSLEVIDTVQSRTVINVTVQIIVCTQSPKYYTTLNSFVKKYYNNDTIYVPKQSKKIKLTIYDENGTVNISNLKWKNGSTTQCTNINFCEFDATALGIMQIKLDSASKTIIRNPIVVYENPTITFHIKDGYFSQYGFDDSAHTYLKDSIRYKRGYEIKTINGDTSYKVPWMSLVDNQKDTVKINKTTSDLDEFSHDMEGSVTFYTSTNYIKINGQLNYSTSYSQLKNLRNITIEAKEWDPYSESNKTIGNILIINSWGDTLGKLNLSCQKPIDKQVVLVFVNTGSGFRNVDRQKILDSLNLFSHNHLFRKWNTYIPTSDLHSKFDSLTINGMDTINLSQEFITYNSRFQNDDTLMKYIPRFYESHKNGMAMYFDVNHGTSHSMSNASDKVHFVFIFNYNLPYVGGSRVDGSTQLRGCISLLFLAADYQTRAHELGHILAINHPFPEWNSNLTILRPRLGIPKFQSKNFMDYTAPGKPDVTNMFYFAQWILTY